MTDVIQTEDAPLNPTDTNAEIVVPSEPPRIDVLAPDAFDAVIGYTALFFVLGVCVGVVIKLFFQSFHRVTL
ncbi:hypothetical protein IHE26_07350 [Plesiomonas shigelloides]|uniref:hypothetical protein n=1 Tax=Plesiomonas shigelloides TaxID=703 RepID=UPI001783739F|nr:hypothetical protein [Plesiomonas shigelloides]QOH81066.1 hypothetical protein IHE26_07350 [Plesiomonas shigelloides]